MVMFLSLTHVFSGNLWFCFCLIDGEKVQQKTWIEGQGRTRLGDIMCKEAKEMLMFLLLLRRVSSTSKRYSYRTFKEYLLRILCLI